MQSAYWYSNFEDGTLFERSRAFAQQRGVLLWDSATKQQMVVTSDGGCLVEWQGKAGLVRMAPSARVLTARGSLPACVWCETCVRGAWVFV